MLRMRTVLQQMAHHRQCRGADVLAPVHKPPRRPLRVLAMRVWHMVSQRRECALAMTAGMRGNAVPPVHHADAVGAGVGLDLFPHQTMGHRVIVPVDLDMVVDIDRGLLHLGVDVGRRRQGSQRRALEALECLTPRTGQALEGTSVQLLEQRCNRRIELTEREEGMVAKAGQHPSLHHLNPDFRLRLVNYLQMQAVPLDGMTFGAPA